MKYKTIKKLDDIATELTGIVVNDDREYQRLIYKNNSNGISKQIRKEFFKAKKRIL